MAYVMKAPYFFAGQDLSMQPDAKQFIQLLCKKADTDPKAVSTLMWNNSHAMYVIAQLKVTGSNAADVVNAIKKWFWDPKNQMLKFEKK